MNRRVVLLAFFSFLWAQEQPAPQDTISIQAISYAVVIQGIQPISTIEALVLLDTLLDMPAEELLQIDTSGNTTVIPTEKVMSVMDSVAGENKFCEDRYCARMVAKELDVDKIILVDISEIEVESGPDLESSFSGNLILSVAYVGVGTDIKSGEDVELLITEKTYPKKLEGDWEELAVRIRSRTWHLMSAEPPEGRFPPELVKFELSDLLLFIEDSPEMAILIGMGVLAGLVGGYLLVTRPPPIGDPPPFPETL